MKINELEKELSRLQGVRKNVNYKNKRSNYVGLFVLIFLLSLGSCLTASFALNNIVDEHRSFSVKINIENGYQDLYVKDVDGGAFSAVIDSKYQIGNIECSKGNLKYDINNRTAYTDNVDSDIECKLSFYDDSESKIDVSQLNELADNYGISYYFDSDATNNYLKLNYMMFRIVRINGDGTFRLVLDSSLEVSTYSIDYINSYLDTWFNNNLNNVKNIITSDYDLNMYNALGNEFNNELVNLNGYSFRKIGLLSVNEIININGSNKVNGDSYLGGNYFTMNESDDNSVWVVKSDGTIDTASKSEYYGIRPVINVKVSSLSGDGTITNPYIIGEE